MASAGHDSVTEANGSTRNVGGSLVSQHEQSMKVHALRDRQDTQRAQRASQDITGVMPSQDVTEQDTRETQVIHDTHGNIRFEI